MTKVDLSQLAIDRGGTAQPGSLDRRHVLTRYVLPLLLLVGVASLAAWASWDILSPPTAVTVIPVLHTQAEIRREGTPLFNAAGWIEPRPTPVRVAALAPGVVEELLVVEDQPVKAGEPIAELVKDDAELAHQRALADLQLREAELDEARAALVAARTRYEEPVHLQAALREAEASLAKIETMLKNLPFETRRAEADREAARKDYEGKIAAKGVVAGIQIDRAKSAYDSAEAFVEELRDRSDSLVKEKSAVSGRRDALKRQLELLADEIKARDEAEAKVNAARARVEQARVAVSEAQLRLDRMTVRAPVDGRVYQLVGDPGATLTGGMGFSHAYDGSTVVTLYRPGMLQVRVDVRFEDIPNVSLGQPVQIKNAAIASPLTGKVLFISSEADIQKNTLQVKVEIDSPPAVFKPEMLVDVTFLAPKDAEQSPERSQEMRLYIPQQLIRQDDGGPFVWVADQSAGVARKTAVETGMVGSSGLVEITSGLTLTSRIIAAGSDRLEDGARIRVTGEDASIGTNAKTPRESSPRSAISRLPAGDE